MNLKLSSLSVRFCTGFDLPDKNLNSKTELVIV